MKPIRTLVNMRFLRSASIFRRGFSTSSLVQNSYKFVVAGGGAGGIGTAAALKRIYGKDVTVAVIEPSQVFWVCLPNVLVLFYLLLFTCLCISVVCLYWIKD